MNILVFEPNLSGHRFSYLNMVTKFFKEQQHSLSILTLASNKDVVLLKELLRELDNAAAGFYIKQNKLAQSIYAGDKLYNRELLNYWMIHHFIKKNDHLKFDFIFIPYLDGLIRLLGVIPNPFKGIRWSGITMVPSFHYEAMHIKMPRRRVAPIEKWLFLKLLKNNKLTKVLTIDLSLYEYIKINYPHLLHQIGYIPDPVDMRISENYSKKDAKTYFGFSSINKIILLYGSVSERKGVLELLKVVKNEKFPSKVGIVVAGVQKEEVKKKIQQLRIEAYIDKKVFFLDKYLSKEEEYLVFKASDLVWCGYKNFYAMSAVLVQASMMGLPVIASDVGMIGWLTRQHHIGQTIEVDHELEIIHAIEKLLADEKLYRKFSKNGAEWGNQHTMAAFNRQLLQTFIGV